MIPVTIIGGGATGAIIALHLRGLLPGSTPITVVEPRETLGKGLAYGTPDPEHRINVPASKMSGISQNPLDFSDWLAVNDDEPPLANGDRYPSRAQFGRYLTERLAPFLKAGTIQHRRDHVASVHGNGPFEITTASGAHFTTRLIVIATSHPPPALPRGVPKAPWVVENPWTDGVLNSIEADERVAIIGTGLSMADVIVSLSARGHRGPILAFSRRGLRSRGHAAEHSVPFGAYGAPTAVALLQQIRKHITQSGNWYAVIDAVRQQGASIWDQLNLTERRRLVRHLRPFWDVHRFRIAPQIEQTLNERIAQNRLEILGARLEHVSPDRTLTLKTRAGKLQHWQADRLINTTGPDHRGILHANTFLRGLAQDGSIAPDPVGLGLHTTADYRAVGQKSLFIAGPLARGTFGELMGLPEITVHAEACAEHLARALTVEAVPS